MKTSILAVTTILSVFSSQIANAEDYNESITAFNPAKINSPINENPNKYLDREGLWNYSINKMRANYSLARGYDGRIYLRNADGSLKDNIADGNVIVGVIDTGVNSKLSELDANVLASKSVTCTTSKGCVLNGGIDTAWHGTAVAGIIAAERNGYGMNGVAPNAKILPIAAIGVSGGSIADSIKYAVNNKALVINNSYGLNSVSGEIPIITATSSSKVYGALSPNSLKTYLDQKSFDTSLRQSIQSAVDNHSIMVFANGNAGMNQVGVLAGLPYYFRGNLANNVKPAGYDVVNPDKKDWSKNFVAVAALDENNLIASYSNRCGIAKDWCISAPGSNVISTYITEGLYVKASGTSFAAPNVSGALAALMGAFPHLSPENVTQILFKTATDLGAKGVDEIYGNGLVNMERAVAPSDSGWNIALSPSTTSNITPVSVSSIALPASFGTSIKTKGLNMMFLDADNKDYMIPLSSLTSSISNRISSDARLAAFGTSVFDYNRSYGKNLKFSASFANDSADSNSSEIAKSASSFSIPTKEGSYDGGFAYHVNASEVIGFAAFAGSELAPKEVSTAFKNPYLGLAENVNSSYVGYSDDSSAIRVGFFQGDINENPDDFAEANKISGAFSEFTLGSKGSKALSFTLGMNKEENSLLGATSSGAFDFGNNSTTMYGSVAGKYQVSKDVALLANYNIGSTKTKVAANSLVSKTSTIISDSFAVGAEFSNVAKQNDKLTVSLSQPLRVMSGKAELRLPQDVSEDGEVLFDNQNVSLEASGRELNLQAAYDVNLDETQSLKLGSELRFQADNNHDAKVEGLVMAKYKLNF